MKGARLTQSARLVCITLALGVHAAAAAAFMLAPAARPPEPAAGVEIAMLAEITAEVADDVAPAVAAQTIEAAPAPETQPGEARTVTGAEVDAMASRDVEPSEVRPTEVEEIETGAIAIDAPVELEKPVVEAPEAPALAAKPKAAVKKAKAQQRRAAVTGSAVSKVPTRKGTSSAQRSGGTQASAAYKSIITARVSSRLPAMVARMRENGSRQLRVALSISSSGRISSISVFRSSGNAALDSDVRAIIAAIDFPPPPPGTRSTWTVPIQLIRR